MNSCIISGRLATDPKPFKTQNGIEGCSFIIAAQRPRNPSKTDFVRVTAWRANAKFVCKYFTKGKRIEIRGYLSSNYSDNNGVKIIDCRLVAEEIGFGESKKNVTSGDKDEKENLDEIDGSILEPPADESQTSTELLNVLERIPETDFYDSLESAEDYEMWDEIYDEPEV